MSRVAGGEIKICGMPQAFCREISVGRLRFFDAREQDYDRAVVCFEDAERLRIAIEGSADFPFCSVSAVLCPHSTADRLSGALFDLGTPYFILPARAELSRSLEGRLALLDRGRGELTIDPELDTLCRYSAADLDIASMAGIRKSRICHDVLRARSLSGEGILCDCRDLAVGGEIFDVACDLVERLCPTPITLGIASAAKTGEERFCESAEAAMRAAVYGNLSLMLKGGRSESEIRRDLGLLQGCFCRLLKEGREFNGYIPRGIFISSPLLLYKCSSLPKSDFICLDFSSLGLALTGAKKREDMMKGYRELLDFFCDWRRSNRLFEGACELRASCELGDARELFWEWCELLGVKEVYIGGGI